MSEQKTGCTKKRGKHILLWGKYGEVCYGCVFQISLGYLPVGADR